MTKQEEKKRAEEFWAGVEKNRQKALKYWGSITDQEIALVRDFRESVGVDFYEPKEAFMTVDKPVKGYCDLLVSWDNELDQHIPFQMGYWGYETEWEALDEAWQSALNLKLPLNYTTKAGQHIYM
jgi:hypothetical protein